MSDPSLKAELEQEVEEKLSDPKWWEYSFTPDGFELETASCLARCMRNIDQACKGELIAIQAITEALSRLQREAKLKAIEQEE